jgi:hypothetical protein
LHHPKAPESNLLLLRDARGKGCVCSDGNGQFLKLSRAFRRELDEAETISEEVQRRKEDTNMKRYHWQVAVAVEIAALVLIGAAMWGAR